MKLIGPISKRAALGAAGVLVALGGAGTAYAASGSSPAAPSPRVVVATTSTSTAVRRARGLLARSDHATLELKVKGQWVTYTLDRGKVQSVSPTSITLDRPDGQSVTETITASTHFAGVATEQAVQPDRPATVISDNGTALRILQRATTPQPPGSTNA